MISLSTLYPRSFFSRRHKLNWRAIPFCQAVVDTFRLKGGSTIIDVGCATGDLVKEFQNLSMKCVGLEGSEEAIAFLEFDKKYLRIHDLRVHLPPEFDCYERDLCLCLEVAEHIDPEYVDVFCDNLCYLSNTILLSAAPPGQGGHHHVNCQPREYWEEKFRERGYERYRAEEFRLTKLLLPFKDKPGIRAYYRNMMILRSPK